MKYRLSAFIGLIISFMLAVPALADMSKDEAEVYVSEIIEYITENYMGDNEVSVEELVQAAISGMTGVLDEYSQYYTLDQYDEIMKSVAKIIYKPCFDVEMDEDGVWELKNLDKIKDTALKNLRNGDDLIKVGELDVRAFSQSELNSVLSSSKSGTISITVARGNREITKEVNLFPVTVKTVEIGDLSELIHLDKENVDPAVGYVKISTIGEGTADEFSSTIANLKKNKVKRLILDLRGNTGGYSDQAIDICKLIVPNGVIISTQDKVGNRESYRSDLKEMPFDKIVVLVDNMTASASEIIASAVKESGAGIIVGESTFGKGIMQSIVAFEDLGYLKMTSYEYYSRNGNKINGVGITPDVPVNDILFLSKDDTIDSIKVAQAMDYLGYNASSTNAIKKSIGSLQMNEGLPITYKLDSATISAINVKIYRYTLSTDRTLLIGYLNSAVENE